MNIYRDTYCGLVTEEYLTKNIVLSGFVANIRDHGGVTFLDLRDQTGIIQVVSNDSELFLNVTKESTIKVEGKVRKRNEEDFNLNLKTGKLEVLVEKLEILGKAKNMLPFDVKTSKQANEEIRLKYRYLDLRNEEVYKNIILRNNIIKEIRSIMDNLNFLEMQTPILTASSPEGARDFVVPARKFPGKFYALPQAPQIFKQLLMISGFDKYYQIAPCFRDEDARSDRIYGEFYQLDFEMSFATEEDVLKIGEEVFYKVFKKFGKKELSKPPFRRIPYKEAIDKYGTDKPDLRNPLEIIDTSSVFKNTTFGPFKNNIIKSIVVNDLRDKPNSWFNEVVDYAKEIGMPGIGYLKVNDDLTFDGPIDKFLSDDERKELLKVANLKSKDVIFFIADKLDAPKLSGLMRIHLGEKLNLLKDTFEFCIVNDFPMFEYNRDLKKYEFTHNPFSMPHNGIKAFEKDLLDILAHQYDFVCNGIELASGAVRNHDLEVMKKAFSVVGYGEEVIKEQFKSLYDAFQYGPPPHAGMAPGIDRIIMLISELDNIRDTIAFPMTAGGQDLMMGSPTELTAEQLKELHIKIDTK